jgi:uncharacterized coiled-coil DUF342 family protein
MNEEETYEQKCYRYDELDKEINKLSTKLKNLRKERDELAEDIKTLMNEYELDETQLSKTDSRLLKTERKREKQLPRKAVEKRVLNTIEDPNLHKKIHDILNEKEEYSESKLKREKY